MKSTMISLETKAPLIYSRYINKQGRIRRYLSGKMLREDESEQKELRKQPSERAISIKNHSLKLWF